MRKGLKFTLSFLFVSILTLNSCLNIKENIVVFGKLENGDQVYKYLLKNNDCEVEVITYGGIITSIKVPDKNNNLIDVALGFDNLEPYLNKHPYFGAIVGRYANRIDDGKFILNNVEYNLAVNNNGASLHGGIKGFDKVNWKVVSYDSENKRSIKLYYLSKDMEEGYPGNLNIYVTYTLSNDNELSVKYEAETDRTTVINLTQHTYFNLSGESSGDILDHELELDADSFLPVNEKIIPTGEIKNVEGTPFDFRKRKKIGRDLSQIDNQLSLGNGYDHCWVLNNYNKELRKIGEAQSTESMINMEVFTDLPGVQLYIGNFLDGSLGSKKGMKYVKRSGFCLETQFFPNSPNTQNFPSTVLEPGNKFSSMTTFKFSLLKN
jgi:aldose 1-epimerase|tara:strand:- start:2353 stop:3486 length:1134 start_codon:yes stop_codon:yes gene_type:complete